MSEWGTTEKLRQAIEETIRFRSRCRAQMERRLAAGAPNLPAIRLRTVEAMFEKNIASPSPAIRANICVDGDDVVGMIEFSVSPLLDCIFVQSLEVGPEHRRRKIATAALKLLSDCHGGLPLVVTHEKLTAHAFWHRIHQLSPWIPVLDSRHETDDLHERRFAHLGPAVEGWLCDREVRRAPAGWVPIDAEE